jgi:predicted translin family RNA/ssDNA-binding protein
MINKKFIQKLKKDYDRREEERRRIIALSNAVLHGSKRVIFALHRADIGKAEKLLDDAEKTLISLEKKFSFNRIVQEGAYKAAAEEYVEAKMFYRIMAGQKVDKVNKIKLDLDSLLGGICDLTGELVRRAINMAAQGDSGEVEKIKKAINEIMVELVEFDMTGYLRAKYDQAKANLRKIEHISYEIRLRK